MKQLIRTTNIFIFLFWHLISFASDDYLQIANEANNKLPKQTAIYLGDATHAITSAKKMTSFYQSDALLAKQQANEILAYQLNLQNKNNNKNPNSSILIFVSFSMPESSLIAYLKAAKKIHAALIIRGLIDNSFQKTLMRMTRLVKESDGEGVQLNPILFKQFAIKAVPAIVTVHENQKCFDVVYGDVPLFYALKTLRDKGTVPDTAQFALQKLKSSQHA